MHGYAGEGLPLSYQMTGADANAAAVQQGGYPYMVRARAPQ
jgi:hypothetical protein